MTAFIRLFLLIFFLVNGFLSMAQKVSFTGRIATTNNTPVEGATVQVLNTNVATITDQQGNFTFSLQPGQYSIYISSLGYAAKVEKIDIGEITAEKTFTLTETATQLDDIVVTAEKEEATLTSVPYSVSTMSSSQVQAYRLWNSNELTGVIPNLYSAHSGDNRNVTSLRGITTTSYDPAVATYIDGVNQFSLDTYIPQLFDIERIEVLRGPQGTLYGRNAMGGVINIITKKPTNRSNAFIEANAGSFGQQRYAGGFRTPLVKNKLFLGLSGMYDRTNGYYTNTFDDSDFDKRNSVMANGYLTYLPNAAWTFTLNAKTVNNRNYGIFPLAGTYEDAFANPYEVNQNAKTKAIDNTSNISLNVNHTNDVVQITSLTTYQSNYRYYKTPIDADFSEFDIITIINNYGKDWNNVKVFTEEVKVSSAANSNSPLKWTAGAFGFYQNNPVKQTTRFGANGDFYGAQPNTSIINTSEGSNKGFALFAQATYSLHEKLDLMAGLRYDYENKDQSVRGSFQADPDPNPIFDIVPDTSATASFSALSPKVSIAFKPLDILNIYATYSKGYRAGGFTQLSSDPSQPPLHQYKPEYSNNIEVGFKGSLLENKMTINTTLFLSTITDVQVPTLILPEGFTITKNTGELVSKGVEFELSAKPTNGLQIDYNIGLTYAKYTNLIIPEDNTEVNLEGNRQIFTPAATSMLAMQYNYALSGKSHVFVRGEWKIIGRQYFDLENTLMQRSYSLLNTRIGFATPSFEIAFWMRNITDEKYVAYAYNFGATHLGEPASLGVSIRKTFDF